MAKDWFSRDPRTRHDLSVAKGFSFGNLEVVIDKYRLQKAADFFGKDFPKVCRDAFNDAAEDVLTRMQDIVKCALETSKGPNGVHWEPLSENTLNRYSYPPFSSFNSDILNLSGYYARTMAAAKPRRAYGRWQFGVPKGMPGPQYDNKSARLDLESIARIHEYGAAGGTGIKGALIPARPLYAPAFNQAVKQITPQNGNLADYPGPSTEGGQQGFASLFREILREKIYDAKHKRRL